MINDIDKFYSAFEERYRGSRDLIKSRLKVYLPFIQPLKELYENAEALDLGCGRGEWLELLKENGFDAQGVDLDEGMLSACLELGLKVQTRDAISILKESDSESQTVISGFHIAEHIPFSDLQILVQEALRVLRPGGLLILETPNPENIAVGTSSFYMDPTHKQPIPHQLLSFVSEYYGFNRVKLLRLQESESLHTNKSPALQHVLESVSPDYAIVSQKQSENNQLGLFDEAFDKEYGLSLSELASRYEARIARLEATAARAEATAVSAEATAASAEAVAERIRNSLTWRAAKWVRDIFRK